MDAEPAFEQVSVTEQEVHALKPMNCPAQCLIFGSKARSYRELPMRIADFSPLHRNEASGSLSGLTRVRRFHQDDAHIFCSEESVKSEILATLDFMGTVYDRLQLPFNLTLATRPENFIGDVGLWDRAEADLHDAIASFSGAAHVATDPGGGAFYGPKIDVKVTDAMKRQHQCATIQLDFQLPRRFDLSYADSHGHKCTPVMIHRALFGSVERMMAILMEHTAGKWPLWISPRQCAIIPMGMSNSNAHKDDGWDEVAILEHTKSVARALR
jgi:threonyl-tRNA synthetase